jgi:aryl-alcohol dehydrogenase-like predicted oxidoreductase
MKTTTLGRTGITVTKICFGTMTFGQQNTEAEAHEQLSYAIDERGINFIDTAEMYPVPPNPETQGRTESYIGSWLKARGKRDDLVLATKVSGPGRANPGTAHIRPAPVLLDRRNIRLAIEASLQRLGTDYVDLYQLHWPDRAVPTFGGTKYVHQPEIGTPIEETLSALGELVAEGKVRAIGLSNETPWGVMKFLEVAGRLGLPRVATIQNVYSLVSRLFELGLSEVALQEDVPLLAYSPLAGGTLSGKYVGGARPEGARMTMFSRFTRYSTKAGVAAIEAYVKLARDAGLDPSQMALAFTAAQPFVAAPIIGATSMAQLKLDIDAFDITLSDDVLAGIEEIHTASPNPCP